MKIQLIATLVTIVCVLAMVAMSLLANYYMRKTFTLLNQAMTALNERMACIEQRERISITCPRCGMTSYSIRDVEEKYCGNCHRFHEHMGTA